MIRISYRSIFADAKSGFAGSERLPVCFFSFKRMVAISKLRSGSSSAPI